MPKYDFSGKNVLITGATGGIGEAVARRFAESGAFVLLHTHRKQAQAEKMLTEIRQNGGKGDVVVADFGDNFDLNGFLKQLLEKTAQIDILVLASGLDLMTPEISSQTFAEKLKKILDVDVFATVQLSKELGYRMKEQGKGTIFFFGWDGVDYGWAGNTAELYGLAKGALQGFSRSLAESLAPAVKIRELSLGWIKTRWGKKSSVDFEEKIIKDSLQNRWGEPSDVADVVLFLSSDVSEYMDGINLRINGGKRGTKS